MKKKLLTIVLSVVTAFIVSMTFVACGNDNADSHPADTFYKGSLSEETYSTSDEAAKAFIETEIKGEATDARFVSYAKKADLTEEEFNALDISAEEKENIESAEKGDVKYTVKTNSEVLTSAEDEKLYFVILVRYKDQTIKYYSPIINTGDPLTKTYYDKIFASENFKNVTIEFRLTMPVTIKADGQTVSVKQSLSIDAWRNGKTYDYLKGVMAIDFGQYAQEMGGNKTTTIEKFKVNDSASPLYKYVFDRKRVNDEAAEWKVTSKPVSPELGNDADISDDYSDDMSSKLLPDFDYSYFIKTNTGFKINSEKLSEFMKIALNDSLDEFMGISDGTKLDNLKASADYYVYDGKITESVLTINYSHTMNILRQEVVYSVNQKTTAKYKNYGTTVVDIPEDLDLDSFAA